MSKITEALEKAARERRRRNEERPTVEGAAATVAVVQTDRDAHLGAPRLVGRVQVDPHIVCATDATSLIAEQYRMLRTNLQSLQGRPGSKVIALTSAVHDEGKTVTALNLALACAHQGNRRVLYLDADLRKDSARRWLGLDNGHGGLSDILQRGGEANGSVLQLEAPALSVITAGARPENPAELLSSQNMKRLLARVRAQFDLVIVDTPALLPVTDATIVAGLADAVLVVIRAGKTSRRIVRKGLQLLQQVKAPVAGCIVTHIEHHLPGYARYYEAYQREAVKRHAESTARADAAPRV